MFLNCSTCFERQTAHHQELKNCNCSLWFYILCDCRELSWLSHDSCRQPQTYVKPEAAITVFELLMLGGLSLETCWAIKKHWNSKFYYTFASCWLFIYDLYYDARTHEYQVSKQEVISKTTFIISPVCVTECWLWCLRESHGLWLTTPHGQWRPRSRFRKIRTSPVDQEWHNGRKTSSFAVDCALLQLKLPALP